MNDCCHGQQPKLRLTLQTDTRATCLYQLGTSTCVFVCVSVSRRWKFQGAVKASSSLGILLLGSVEWSLGSRLTMTRLSQQDETRYCETETRALLLCMLSSSFRQKLKQKHLLLNISSSSIRGKYFYSNKEKKKIDSPLPSPFSSILTPFNLTYF